VKALPLLLVAVAAVAVGCGGHKTPFATRVFESGYVSPDGKWSLAYTRQHGYDNLDVTDRATGSVSRMYSSNDGCCAQITWLRPHLLIFVDDYKTRTLDPVTKHVVMISNFSNFVVSPDGRWVAGWADCGGHCAERVDVVPIGGGRCRQVPHRPDQDDNARRFSPDDRSLTILRRFFDVKNGEPIRNGLATRWHAVTIPVGTLQPVATC
jgi:hypothetical protein